MSQLPHTLAAFALALGLLVFVHEFGHYWVARRLGVKVLSFSIGFGKPLWSRRFGADGTEWMISAIPLGGFVRMLDEHEGEVAPAELHRAYNRQPPLRRMAIAAAGPAANFLLAIVLYWALFWHGVEEPRPFLGEPPAASAAAAAGVVRGERVLKVGGVAVDTWQDLRWALLRESLDRDAIELEVIDAQSNVAVRRVDLAAARESGWDGDALERIGLVPGRPQQAPIIGEVQADGGAAVAGLRVGDRIVAIDGRAIDDWSEVVGTIRVSPGQSLGITVLRGDGEFSTRVAVASEMRRGREVGRIGIGVLSDEATRAAWLVSVRHPPLVAFAKAVEETWDKSVLSLVMMGRMLTGDVSWRNLSGPVTIANYAGQSAQLGFDYYLRFLALISLSLGVLNLLPIPILDGGHLLYYLAEIIRGAPLSERAMDLGQRIGIALIALLMVFAFYNDLSRLLSG